MKAQTRQILFRCGIFAFLFAAVGFAQLPGIPSEAQKMECGCENLDACDAKPSPSPSPKATPRKEPPKPKKIIRMRNVFKEGLADKDINPNVNDPKWPGLDFGTGTAPDTANNESLGHSEISGYFAERRRFVYNTYRKGEQFVRDGKIPPENLAKLESVLKERLEQINEEERAAYLKESAEALREVREQLEGQIDEQNTKQTNETIKEIEDMDLDEFENKIDDIGQVIYDNLAQGRSLELLGGNGEAAMQRAKSIVDALRKKISADCGKKKITPQKAMTIERVAQLMGGADAENTMDKCFTRTIVAHLDLPGFQFDARRCIRGRANREAMEGEWKVVITGEMPLTGMVQMGPGGVGNWEAKGLVGDEVFYVQEGGAELVSGGGMCLLRLKRKDATGTTLREGRVVRVQGITGDVRIRVLDQPCE